MPGRHKHASIMGASTGRGARLLGGRQAGRGGGCGQDRARAVGCSRTKGTGALWTGPPRCRRHHHRRRPLPPADKLPLLLPLPARLPLLPLLPPPPPPPPPPPAGRLLGVLLRETRASCCRVLLSSPSSLSYPWLLSSAGRQGRHAGMQKGGRARWQSFVRWGDGCPGGNCKGGPQLCAG